MAAGGCWSLWRRRDKLLEDLWSGSTIMIMGASEERRTPATDILMRPTLTPSIGNIYLAAQQHQFFNSPSKVLPRLRRIKSRQVFKHSHSFLMHALPQYNENISPLCGPLFTPIIFDEYMFRVKQFQNRTSWWWMSAALTSRGWSMSCSRESRAWTSCT